MDCAETACMPVLSSSVSDARKTPSADPKCSTSFRDLVGPSPGVRDSATHATRFVAAGEATSFDTMDSERTVISAGKGCQGHTSQCPVNIVESTELRMRRLRISAISYLNTAPLIWDFEHKEACRHFEIAYTLPSACARNLAEGTADIGIIPAAAYTQIPGLQVLPDVAIASRRAVRSILLVSKTPLEKVRTVALDTSSMTSVALTK